VRHAADHEQCYLDPKVQVRNPGLGRKEIEQTLKTYLGVTTVQWLAAGPAGDDTHGHIDDICRFVNPWTVVLIKETNRKTSITARWPRTGSACRTCGWRTALGLKLCRYRCRTALLRRQPPAGELCELLYRQCRSARPNVQ